MDALLEAEAEPIGAIGVADAEGGEEKLNSEPFGAITHADWNCYEIASPICCGMLWPMVNINYRPPKMWLMLLMNDVATS